MDIIIWVLLFIIYYNFDGYLRLLKIISFIKLRDKKIHKYKGNILPSVTVLLTVYNEEAGIVEKIDDILKQEYPKNKIHILVASDGSTDNTDALVLNYGNPNVNLFRPLERRGKSDTQNKAIKTIKDDIILFTDCDTRFEACCLLELVKPFEDDAIGCTSAQLLFKNDKKGNVNQGQSFYWNYELQLRNLESQLNCLAIATGACMCMRIELFKPFSATYGEDCIIPLDIVSQGFKVFHVKLAIAYDKMPDSQDGEFNARVRMTLRNWQGTWSRSSLLNPIKHPKYAFALWSHKLLRWLSPIFLISLTISSAYLANTSIIYSIVILILLASYIIGIIGFFSSKQGKVLPIYFRIIYSFMLANAGFLVGLWYAFIGKKIRKYAT